MCFWHFFALFRGGEQPWLTPRMTAHGLTTITVHTFTSQNTEVVGESEFQYCSGLTSITIPYGVTLLDEYTFSDCTSLREVDLPNSLTTINSRAFQNCEKLTEITIPYSVTYINSYAFKNHNTALLIRGAPGSVAGEFATEAGIDFEAVGIDEMPPILTAGTSERTSLEQAVVTFTTNEACEYYYAVVEDGADQPELDTTADGTACTTGEVAVTVTGLTSGAKDIYLTAKDADGMVSSVLAMDIHEYEDITAPVLSDGSWNRISYTEAEITFTANEGGTFYYVVYEAGDETPSIETVMAGISADMAMADNTITLTDLDPGALDLYIAGEDYQGNTSDILKVEIGGFPTTPEDFTAEALPVEAGTSSVLFTWINAGDADEYYFYQSESEDNLLEAEPRVLSGKADYCYANGLDASTTYYFALAAVNSVGSGEVVYSGAVATQAPGSDTQDVITVRKIAGYSTGTVDTDGGVAEMVEFNKENGKFYIVNGATSPAALDIVTLPATGYPSSGYLTLTSKTTIDIESLLAANVSGFTYGDLSCVSVSTVNDRIYLSVQEDDYINKNGIILVLDYDGNYIHYYQAGFGPDMIVASKNGRYILTADEAEPRGAAQSDIALDPKGSVTIVDTMGTSGTDDDTVTHVYFDDVSKIDDDVHVRGVESQADSYFMVPRDKTDAVTDFEPEFITLSEDSGTAYVSLQENNAIAVIDVAAKTLVSVKSLGFKDLRQPENSLDVIEDSNITLENIPAFGMYMPDAVASFSVDGKTYILTANEGDFAEFYPNNGLIQSVAPYLTGDEAASFFYTPETQVPSGTQDEVYFFYCARDMGNTDEVYLFGARSFSIWDADTMAQVYDSCNDFEVITAQRLPSYFNIDNDHYKTKKMDKRSPKKGPEPEGIEVGVINGRTFAFVGLERIGGMMTYDITDPENAFFVNYINTRPFDGSFLDSAPEGLDFIPAADSPTGTPLVLMACEVGGTVAVFQIDVPLQGDLDGDGDVDRADVAVVRSYLRQEASVCPACDLDGDGTITVRDARKVITLYTN